MEVDEDEDMLVVDEGADDLPSDLVIDEGENEQEHEGAEGTEGVEGAVAPTPTSNLQFLIDNIYKYFLSCCLLIAQENTRPQDRWPPQ